MCNDFCATILKESISVKLLGSDPACHTCVKRELKNTDSQFPKRQSVLIND